MQKKKPIVLFDDIKTGKTDSENENSQIEEEKDDENEHEKEEIIENDANQVKKINKKRTPGTKKDVEEKPLYVSTRKYNLSSDEEETDDENEKKLVNIRF